ncbi:MAG: 50S ribosomal protein L18a [Candidatus Diapherotrites archaeon]|jgi:ribosomal protein L20A (L18A)|nr:50S ribosomal protein L18a [Candidatus Diapherotrites archaeon]MBT4596942.1 50S ribosomal protein L18a [Candidatus Diapherotrites archaeon]
MKIFEATGTYNHKGEQQTFSKRVKADDEKGAREQVLCLIGSKQRIPRRFIEITKIGEEK